MPNIFGQTGAEAGQEGLDYGINLATQPQQAKAQTSLLSDRAEFSRMALAAEKDKAATALAERASLQKALEDNPQLDLSKISDQIKARDVALKSPATKNNIPLMQALTEEKSQLHKQQAEVAVEAMNQDAAQNEQFSSALNQFLTDPTNTQVLQDSIESGNIGEKNIGYAKHTMAMFAPDSRVPVPESLYSNPGQQRLPGANQRPYSKLTPEEQERVKFNIRQGNEKLTASQKDALAMSKLNYNYAQLEEKAKAEEAKNKEQARRTAALREKQSTGKADKAASDERKAEVAAMTQRDRELAAAEATQAKIRTTYGISDPTDTETKGSFWWKEAIPKITNKGDLANFTAAEARKERAKQTYNDKIKTLQSGKPPTEIVPSSSDKVVGHTPDGKEVYENKEGKRYTKG